MSQLLFKHTDDNQDTLTVDMIGDEIWFEVESKYTSEMAYLPLEQAKTLYEALGKALGYHAITEVKQNDPWDFPYARKATSPGLFGREQWHYIDPVDNMYGERDEPLYEDKPDEWGERDE